MTTVKHGKIQLVEPRISLFGSGHPDRFIEHLVEEHKPNTSGGFITRFMLIHPELIQMSLSN
jgi:hypothetical protein